MHVIHARNVNDAYAQGYAFFKCAGFSQKESRGGLVMEAPYPVTTEYEFPDERVLFSAKRDANPFFHLFEALWMLAGRSDVEFLRQFSEQAARLIEGGSSYGYRWRKHFEVDQLTSLIELLRNDPDTRRAVIAMWDPKVDLGGTLKDHPCNDTIQFSLRRGSLDMQVFCRSNDMIWGAYGANAVHMSLLQEYVAQMLGASIGHYWQISCNFHVYMDIYNQKMPSVNPPDPYSSGDVHPQPLISDPGCFDDDLKHFLEHKEVLRSNNNPFLSLTAEPMWKAWRAWKSGDKKAGVHIVESVVASDWHIACRRWMERRL